ncbi:MAG: hypothetical protein LBI13_10160 [Streptococcaceae bacterium]|jgi:NAD(P)H-dependent FMN reductase|nr:hypothetical protein [Streptococcaceae bacterium]
MIIVNIAQKQDEIQQFIENQGYSFVKKMGLKLYFEALTEDQQEEAKDLKAKIKSHDASVFFSVEVGK